MQKKKKKNPTEKNGHMKTWGKKFKKGGTTDKAREFKLHVVLIMHKDDWLMTGALTMRCQCSRYK